MRVGVGSWATTSVMTMMMISAKRTENILSKSHMDEMGWDGLY